MLNTIWNYIRLSLLYMLLGTVVLYFAGKPLASYIIAHADMIIVKGSPIDQNEEMKSIKTNGTLDQSEIQTPEINKTYGMITCKRIDLQVPLYYGDSDQVLQNGAGQYRQSGLPGQGKPILISGHDTTFFAPLNDIRTDDIIHITTDYGEFNYKVVNTRIADKADTTAYNLSLDKEQLILYTCYPFGKLTGDRSDRYFIYCDRIPDAVNDTKQREADYEVK